MKLGSSAFVFDTQVSSENLTVSYGRVMSWISLHSDLAMAYVKPQYVQLDKPSRIATVKLKIPGKLFFKVEFRNSVTFKL